MFHTQERPQLGIQKHGHRAEAHASKKMREITDLHTCMSFSYVTAFIRTIRLLRGEIVEHSQV